MTKTLQKNIRVTPEQWARIEDAATSAHSTANQLVIELAIEALDRRARPRTAHEVRLLRASMFTAQAIARLIADGRVQEIREFIYAIVPDPDAPTLDQAIPGAGNEPRDVEFPEGYPCVGDFALHEIVTPEGKNNNLTPLNRFKGRKGVYMIADGDTVLYIGSSTEVNKDWGLKNRIAQHFRKNDTGATLWRNWRRKHRCCDCRFGQFLNRMQECNLQVISFRPDADDQSILRLEHLLIGLLGPEYCDVPQ